MSETGQPNTSDSNFCPQNEAKRDGRPCLIDAELVAKFVAAVRRVYFVSVAAELLELDPSTCRRWLRLGKAELARLRKGKPLRSPNAEAYMTFAKVIGDN